MPGELKCDTYPIDEKEIDCTMPEMLLCHIVAGSSTEPWDQVYHKNFNKLVLDAKKIKYMSFIHICYYHTSNSMPL
eukprot:SAG31_NODE_1930_length_6881_cov_6.976998_4_plen_76_part_00